MLPGVHSFINLLTRIRPTVIVQREGQRSTRVIKVSEDDPLGCAFSGRTSPSRCSRGQPGGEREVSTHRVPIHDKAPSYLIVPVYQQGVPRA